MKKYGLLIVCLLVSSVLFSACNSVPNSPINYERKLGKYFEAEENKMTGATIDVVQEIKPSNAVSELMRAGLSTAAVNQLSIEESKGYPNREKCETIIEWLRGE